jgi:hypothetical protein
VSFLNLPGPYGSLDVIARSAHGIEFGFSDSDFVVLDRRQWEVLRHAVDLLFVPRGETETVVVATDAQGEPIVVEDRVRGSEPPAARRRGRSRKNRIAG